MLKTTTSVINASQITGVLPVVNGGTGVTTSTGTGSTVLSTSPTLATPILGVASATSVNKVAITTPSTGATLTIVDGKTLIANNSLTLAGTDATTMTFPTTSATIARTDASNNFTGDQTLATGNLIIGTLTKGIKFANTTWLETVVASYKKSSSVTVAAGTGRSDLYFTVSASKTFTITATGLGGLATIVYGSSGESCTFFWSWNTATISILGNGGTMFAATSTPSASQFGIYKNASSGVLSFTSGSSFSLGNVSICLIGDYASATTDPA